MYLNKRKITTKIVLLFVMLLMFISPVSAVAISDFFSDFTSSDVTVSSSQDFQGRAIFELLYEGRTVESHEVPITVGAGGAVTKVIIWEKKPQQDYYTARVSIYNDSQVLASSTYQVSYGTISLPSFHVVDFSPTNSGVKLLLQPFNPSVVDIKIQLLDNSDIIYEKTRDDVSLMANMEITTPWTFLLTDNKKYTARSKTFTHRLYAAPLINTYVANFTAIKDVEILPEDVEVDEYGASVTLRGNSQVPFDGFIVVKARNRTTNETQVYRQQVEEILTSGKEDTAGVVWRELTPGTYDVEILVESRGNATLDRYETVLRIPEYPVVTATPPAQGVPGFQASPLIAILLIAILLAAARRLKGV